MRDVPAIIQIFVIFALVVTAAARKVHLGLAAALGGIALALWRGLSLGEVVKTASAELFSADLILLLVLMSSIMVFSSAMKRSGAMETFAASIAGATPSRRTAMAIAPLLIGTLPVPGGAILSAPLVESMGKEGNEVPVSLAAANYWFRHNMELVWPLYPAFILTTSLSGLSAGKLASLNCYAPFLLFSLGLAFILPKERRAPKSDGGQATKALSHKRIASLLSGTAPLLLVLGCYLLFSLLWKLVSPQLAFDAGTSTLVARYLPILLGLVAGCGYLALKAGGWTIFTNGFGKGTARLLAVLVGIRVFSSLLGAADLPKAAASELSTLGIPAVVAAALIPFIAGLVTGVGFGYVGLAFPIVLGLFSPSSFPKEAVVVLACAWGYAGMMFSPLHVCMVVSAEHFKASLPAVIRKFALPLAIFLGGASLYAAILATTLR